MRFRTYLISCVLLLSACGGGENETDIVENQKYLVDKNRLLWQSAKVNNYEFTYFLGYPDCSQSGDAFPSRTVKVINGVVVSVYVPEWKQYMEVDKSAFKMENLFDEISNIVLTKPQVFAKSSNELKSAPAFHSEYGFPESVFIDKTKGQCDEYLITVSDFKRL